MSEVHNSAPLAYTIVWKNGTGTPIHIESNITDSFLLGTAVQTEAFLFTPAHLFNVYSSFEAQDSPAKGHTDLIWRTVEDKFALIQQNNDEEAIALQLLPKEPKHLVLSLNFSDDGILIVGTIDIQEGLPPITVRF